ncbi:MAG TPA: hypothetical protein VFZ22_00075, partial [Pyrinomonadaceae bacterium]|nr:hypothetical protein [Pyrinomonadaceae bacterium]
VSSAVFLKLFRHHSNFSADRPFLTLRLVEGGCCYLDSYGRISNNYIVDHVPAHQTIQQSVAELFHGRADELNLHSPNLSAY